MVNRPIKLSLISAAMFGIIACSNGSHTNTYNGRELNGEQSNSSYNASQLLERKIAVAATNIKGITGAAALVHGNDIIIGIDGKNGTNLKALERHVEQTISNQNPGYNVHVTSNEDTKQRIRTLAIKTNNHPVTRRHPIRLLNGDVEDLIRDIHMNTTGLPMP